MRFMVAVVVGALLGLAGASMAVSENSLESVIGTPVLLLFLPVVGGILSFVGYWLNYDPEEEPRRTAAQGLGQAAVAASGMLLGVIIGMFLGFGMGG